MVKSLIVFLLLLSLSGLALPVGAQNPFISKDTPDQVSPAPGLPNPFLARIAAWQHQLNQKMASLTRQAKETGTIRPLLSLVIIAFVYGVLHAAGPGHGKAVATSYLISHGRRPGRGILVGNLIALFHGLSGVGLVLAAHFVLRKGISGSLESVTHITQIVSYSLIALLGAALLTKSVLLWRLPADEPISDHNESTMRRERYSLAMALTVGMIPCPGVAFVMLFCLSLNMVSVGLLLSFSLTLGMAVTISVVGVCALGSKNLFFGVLERRGRMVKIVERVVETTAALMVMVLGLLFLAAAI